MTKRVKTSGQNFIRLMDSTIANKPKEIAFEAEYERHTSKLRSSFAYRFRSSLRGWSNSGQRDAVKNI